VRRDIVLAAGAYNSPKLLMLSGVGPADHLGSLGVSVIRDLPGVGRNLMDHQISSIQMACAKPVSLARHLNWGSQAAAVLQWLARRKGLLASNHFECGAFLRSAAGVEFPDIQLYLFPIAVAEGSNDFMRDHGFQVQISPQRSPSRGSVELASANPDDPPRIRFNYLESERDLIEFRAGFRLTREILGQEALRDYCGEELSPGPAAESDEALDEHIRAHVQSSYHPSGSCKMGQDPMAVVDPQCRVWGLEGLRVADASIMPTVPSCNINCPTMMIGEKAADIIADREPLPPSNLPYHVDPEWRTRQRPRPARSS
jgi:choline dehydrogenase